jgi:hypothetical protein
MSMICVGQAELGMMAFVAFLTPGFFRTVHHVLDVDHAQRVAQAMLLSKQHCAVVPSIPGHLPSLG